MDLNVVKRGTDVKEKKIRAIILLPKLLQGIMRGVIR